MLGLGLPGFEVALELSLANFGKSQDGLAEYVAERTCGASGVVYKTEAAP